MNIPTRPLHFEKTESKYESVLELDETTSTSIESLRKTFVDSPWHALLKQNPPRFERFSKDFSSQEYFIELFGDDIIADAHGPYQARTVAIPLIEAQQKEADLPQLKPFWADAIIAHTVIHDDHEGILGDMPAPYKTTAFEEAETMVWRAKVNRLHGHLADILISRAEELETKTIYPSFERELYDATEKTGYLYNGYRALEIGLTENLFDSDRRTMFLMATSVIQKWSKELYAYRNKLVFVDDLLQNAMPARAIRIGRAELKILGVDYDEW